MGPAGRPHSAVRRPWYAIQSQVSFVHRTAEACSDPVQTRRTKFITKLEEQKLLLKEPNHARTVQRCFAAAATTAS